MDLSQTTQNILTWLAIVLCIAQTGMFAGLNLAIFSLSRLRLEIAANTGDEDAVKVREIRRDSNLTLSTIVWGTVATNVLLTLLSDSVLSGVAAFAFSTVAITFLGELVPQAYFSRHALHVTALLAPVLNFYRIVIYPVAKPTALFSRLVARPRGRAAARRGRLQGADHPPHAGEGGRGRNGRGHRRDQLPRAR